MIGLLILINPFRHPPFFRGHSYLTFGRKCKTSSVKCQLKVGKRRVDEPIFHLSSMNLIIFFSHWSSSFLVCVELCQDPSLLRPSINATIFDFGYHQPESPSKCTYIEKPFRCEKSAAGSIQKIKFHTSNARLRLVYFTHISTWLFLHESAACKTCFPCTYGKTNEHSFLQREMVSMKITFRKSCSKHVNSDEPCGKNFIIILIKWRKTAARIEKCDTYANYNQILIAKIVFNKAKNDVKWVI